MVVGINFHHRMFLEREERRSLRQDLDSLPSVADTKALDTPEVEVHQSKPPHLCKEWRFHRILVLRQRHRHPFVFALDLRLGLSPLRSQSSLRHRRILDRPNVRK